MFDGKNEKRKKTTNEEKKEEKYKNLRFSDGRPLITYVFEETEA